MARRTIIPIAGVPATLLNIATTAITFILAVNLASAHQQTFILTLIAAIAQTLSSCALLFLCVQHFRRRNRREKVFATKPKRPVILYLSVLVAAIAAVVEGVALGWSRASIDNISNAVAGVQPLTFVLLTIGVWAASVILEIIFFAMLVFVRDEGRVSYHEPVESIRETSNEMEETSRPGTSATIRSNPFRETSVSLPSSPMMDSTSLRSSSSLRCPPSARKPLLSRQHSFPRRSANRSSASLNRPSFDSPSPSRQSQDSAFDSWDTSHVAAAMRETVLHSRPAIKPQRQGLEPIPGSRSPSPAKALEGPFYNIDPLPSPPPSPLPQPSVSDSRPSSRGRSATTGASNHSQSFRNEDHIHPLFRTCSPTPPPTASAGSTVVAAPVAGQTVNEKVLRRMRSSSTPASPSPLVRSASFYDFNTAPTTPGEGGVDGDAPPIPEFIMVAGKRSSEERYHSRMMRREDSVDGTDSEMGVVLPGPMPGAISPGLGIGAPPGMI